MPNKKHNWPQLFADYEQSGLSQTEFCKQRDINPKYFSLKLSKRRASEGSPFAKAIVLPEVEHTNCLVLQIGHCKILCPSTMPIPSFVALVKALA
ncbi:hypothetical protein P886_1282 [Alteromonadaceae bacterium 2753L.S.0a.02]|nr:hypothetical protein P886_1981 [Alteromonadaceae bacterium 2753L.S.0a.02]TVZ38007.1 hypothetical protein P886_2357 [Alteromonadaceae bacterium 2753L.S.0a.02]TVZ38660.1 hypothetical protein P886_3036 [Alteromonadaceae bacterium 2753L.S.0a.02]TVZ38699.1 hypothetical protein P886_3078 [Alteromonadaceae bacterium 2753L.S.0a.02]TVZ41931.1 hypothetical protein P886_1282 [Alteromonadaceae bacterium 2753L.S.0a.02]